MTWVDGRREAHRAWSLARGGASRKHVRARPGGGIRHADDSCGACVLVLARGTAAPTPSARGRCRSAWRGATSRRRRRPRRPTAASTSAATASARSARRPACWRRSTCAPSSSAARAAPSRSRRTRPRERSRPTGRARTATPTSRAAVEEATGGAIAREHVIVGSDHSHAGPDTTGVWGGLPDSYLAFLRDQTVGAILDAYAARRDAELWTGSADATDLINSQFPQPPNDERRRRAARARRGPARRRPRRAVRHADQLRGARDRHGRRQHADLRRLAGGGRRRDRAPLRHRRGGGDGRRRRAHAAARRRRARRHRRREARGLRSARRGARARGGVEPDAARRARRSRRRSSSCASRT